MDEGWAVIPLADLRVGMRIGGIGSHPVVIRAIDELCAGAVEIVYRSADGKLGAQILTAQDEPRLQDLSDTTWTFDADATEFRLAAEAMRMKMASLFDPMLAVTTSKVEPLPHQIQAVYGEMLPKPGPLRFLLADDPGAGKTIMAGLYLKELWLRGDVQRCLIVAPGGLVEQWQAEMREKFDLDFTILTRDLADTVPDGNPFPHHPLLIARMDQLARDDGWRAHLAESDWDLVIVDEAHRMSATYRGQELSRTLRYRLGQQLGEITRHLLLMTATPHAGKDEDFHAFLALLDADRFEGAYRQGVHRADFAGLMRRMVKEELLTFEGKSLFPERIAETVRYDLSPGEQHLYEEVSTYVREQMNLADRVADHGDQRRRTTVGFALTVLQRRLASSPAAIHESLVRRTNRLRVRRDDLRRHAAAVEAGFSIGPEEPALAAVRAAIEDPEEVDADELELLEEEVLDSATAARTVAELDVEIAALEDLTSLAAQVRASGTDRKWLELRELLLQARAESNANRPLKLIVFTEHRDTLEYLHQRIGDLLGDPKTVVTIHGGTPRKQRLATRERFTSDPTCAVLVATDAAGEGLNLQAAHLMVNYDLPWNPNRIEQRFGRIHRIGQREVCRLWNLVASGTREGQVFERLLEKIEEQRRAYGGKVFDVLGDHAFGERPLRELLIEAVRYGDDPAVRARLDAVIDSSVAHGIETILRERSLAVSDLTQEDLHVLRREMDEARARRLQPHYVGRFFLAAFSALDGLIHRREGGRYEVSHVPEALRSPRVAPRYVRVCFDPAATEVPGTPAAELLAPGHPLFETVVEATITRFGHTLAQGTVLLDPQAASIPRLVVALVEEIHDGDENTVSQRFSFVAITDDGAAAAGPAPYLDLLPPQQADPETLGGGLDHGALADATSRLRESAWITGGVPTLATEWSLREGLPAHRAEVERRVSSEVERTRRAVTHRLNAQINFWYAEAARLAENQAAGRRVRLSPTTAQQRAADLETRLAKRLERLERQSRLAVRPPQVVGAALVIPAHLVVLADDVATPVDTSLTERRAVDAVLRAERQLGRTPEEMPHNNPGYDILSTRPDGSTIRVEVKGRILGASDFVVTAQEVLTGLNAGDDYRLALVEVDPDGDPRADEVRYILRPFASLTIDESLEASKRLRWRAMWDRGLSPR